MKENPYFKFYTSEWLNGRITLEDVETQGLFINICAWYWHFKGDITVYHVLRRTNNPAGFEKLTDSDIIRLSNEQNIYENKKIIINFLDEQLGQRGVQSVINKVNGKLGGRPKKTESVNFRKPKQNQNITNIDKIREDNNKIIKDKIRFTKPSILEVLTYFISKTDFNWDPTFAQKEANKFYNYYEANGWKVGKNQMKNWQAAANGWISRCDKPKQPSSTHAPDDYA